MKQKEFEQLTKNRRNLNWAYNYYDSYEMYRDLVIQRVDGATLIYAVVDHHYYSPNHVHIKIDDRGVDFKCDCQFCMKDDACGHVLGSILLYEELDLPESKDVFSYADFREIIDKKQEEERIAREKEFEESQRRQRLSYGKGLASYLDKQLRNQVQEIVHKKMYHLDIDLSLEYEKIPSVTTDAFGYRSYKMIEEPVISLKAKIGSEKMYMVKDFGTLFQNIEENNNVKYGKNLEFVHTLDAFEDETKGLIVSLKDMYNRLDTYGSIPRSIPLNKEYFDYLFKTLKEYPTSYMNWEFEEKDFAVQLDVSRNDDLYELMLRDSEGLVCSNSELYELSSYRLTHKKIESEQLKSLVAVLLEDGPILFEEEDLNEIIKRFKDERQLEIIGYHLDIEEEENSLSLYIDIEEDSLVAKALLLIHGKEWNLFDSNCPTTSQSVKKLKYVLESFATTISDKYVLMSLQNELTYRFLEEGLLYIEDDCLIYADESLKDIRRPTSLSLSVGVQLNNGLLEIDINSIQLTKEEIRDALQMYRKKKKYYKLKGGEIINLESDDMKELDHLFDAMHLQAKDLDNKTIQLPLYRSMQIQDELSHASELKAKLNDQLLTFNERFKVKNVSDIKVSDFYKPVLKDYQLYGVKWMLLLAEYGFHGILADDMGLGKTLQIIAMLESDATRVKPSIVVCPASLLFNWEEELKKFESKLSYSCIHGIKEERIKKIEQARDVDLIITTYDYMKYDIDSYKDMVFSYIVIDEAQYIKNQTTKAAKSVKALVGDHRIALTGTPIENSLAELWSIFDFLMPGYLYTYNFFRSNFESPIVKDQNIEKQKELRDLVEPFILRRTKKEVLKELPEKREKILSFEFEEEEEKLYLAKLAQGNQEVSVALQTEHPNQLLILKLLGELRQLCCDPRLLYENYPHISSKTKACLEIVESLVETKQKVLIFSSFTKTLDLIEIELKKRNIKYHMLTGSTSKENRKKLVDTFQNDDSIVFLISLKAAGVGLNLTAAEYVIHFDPWWNVAAENQASDRAHRIGQKKNVQVYKLIMKNSVEEKIVKMQERKKDMSDIFIEGSTGSFASLNKDEIINLFQR